MVPPCQIRVHNPLKRSANIQNQKWNKKIQNHSQTLQSVNVQIKKTSLSLFPCNWSKSAAFWRSFDSHQPLVRHLPGAHFQSLEASRDPLVWDRVPPLVQAAHHWQKTAKEILMDGRKMFGWLISINWARGCGWLVINWFLQVLICFFRWINQCTNKYI